MARSGWKKLPIAKSDAQALERLNRASMLLSEALSNITAVLQAAGVVVDVKYYNAAAKMYDEIKIAERTYHNYLVEKPLDRRFGE